MRAAVVLFEDDGATEIVVATAVAERDGYLWVLTLNRDASVAATRRLDVARDPIAVAVGLGDEVKFPLDADALFARVCADSRA